MTASRSMFEMTQPAFAALAHPIRSRLMSALQMDGPATATRLATRIGESSGSTSYHLRQLAAVGLIEEDTERGTRRERWWKPAHEGATWSNADFLGDPVAHEASIAARRNYYAWQARLLEQRLREESTWDKAWVDAAADSDDAFFLTPAQATAMSREIWDVVQRFRAEQDTEAPDSTRVIWLQHLVPVFGEAPL
ncbi:MAG: helix-turn-helix domain-containing protein [Nocardioides sp.]|uniref:helix-turn-helix domain-containing protein n=1 Tax=Nocardioides sp. TaxID=35761 RepID=UPI0039E39319